MTCRSITLSQAPLSHVALLHATPSDAALTLCFMPRYNMPVDALVLALALGTLPYTGSALGCACSLLCLGLRASADLRIYTGREYCGQWVYGVREGPPLPP